MSTVPPPGAQTPQQPAPTAQSATTVVVREPSVELLRLAAGTRVEGTVLPQPPQTPAPDAARAALQTLQAAQDT